MMLLENDVHPAKNYADLAVKAIADKLKDNFFSYYDGYELLYDVHQEFESIKENFIEVHVMDEDIKEMGYESVENLMEEIQALLDESHPILEELETYTIEQRGNQPKRSFYV